MLLKVILPNSRTTQRFYIIQWLLVEKITNSLDTYIPDNVNL